MSCYSWNCIIVDDDGDTLAIRTDAREERPAFISVNRNAVELFREDVEQLRNYLSSIIDTVPTRPTPVLGPSDNEIAWRFDFKKESV